MNRRDATDAEKTHLTESSSRICGLLGAPNLVLTSLLVLLAVSSARAQHQLASGQPKSEPFVAAASKDGEMAIKKFEVPQGL
jgi:hypothetical protein